MNFPVVLYLLGWIMLCEGVLVLLPSAVSLIYQDGALFALLMTATVCIAVGTLLIIRKPKKWNLRTREGMVVTALGWIVMSIMGALPFLLSGVITDPIDALFETVSGLTTTGASILTDVECVPEGLIFWRSFTHWIGGMGVLVFLLTLMPKMGASHVNLMKAESPGPLVEKLVPKLKTTAMILYGLYIGMTVIEMIALLISGMPLFDSVTLTFGTVGTGGFGIRNDSVASYTLAQQIIITVFMILSGINYNFYFLLILGKFKRAFAIDEVKWYLAIIVVSTLTIAVNTRGYFANLGTAIQQAAFQVGSFITTTGYGTTDFNAWPQLSKSVLLILMFVGACAGSTGGGFKVSRIVILFKTFLKECRQLLHPQSIVIVHMDKKPVSHPVVRSTNVFLVTYIFIGFISFLLVSFDKVDFSTAFTSVTSALNNIGPFFGPDSESFAGFSWFSKLVFIFDMLAGRLELFPLLILFSGHTWKKY